MKEANKGKNKKQSGLEDRLNEATNDLQRIQADFVNYRRRMEEEKRSLTDAVKAATVMKLLPMIDDIDRAISHIPQDLSDNKWAQGVSSLSKNLQKSLSELGVTKINANQDTVFDPNLHEAVSADDSEGNEEVVSEELRAGYQIGPQVIRPSMVRVTRRQSVPKIEDEEAVITEEIGQNPEKESEAMED